MKKKSIFIIVFGVVVLVSLYFLFQLMQDSAAANDLEVVQGSLQNYQISIWLSWVVLIVIAINYKWTRKKNTFFNAVYGYLIVACILFGFYAQKMVNTFGISSGFDDNYTYGVLVALENIVVSAVLTGVVQACVWWFTRRWHRRMR